MTKKTREELAELILDYLDLEPLSIQDLSKKTESNWVTVNDALEELKKQNKVKEIVSTEKIKLYQKRTGDTYFDIPITKEERKKFRTLFRLIMQEYKKRGKIPTKTHLAKTAVCVIKDPNSGLTDLPTVWYIYGMIPLMIADPSEDYKEEFKLENESIIKHLIQDKVSKDLPKGSGQIQKEQHVEYNEHLYTLADKFLKTANKSTFNKEEFLDILDEFFIICPIDEDFPEVFQFTDRFISTVNKLSFFEDIQKFRKEILLTFDALWKFIATYKFYQSMIVQKRFSDKKAILDLYLGRVIEVRTECVRESLSELYAIYLNSIDDREIEISEDTKNIREIMQDWTGED